MKKSRFVVLALIALASLFFISGLVNSKNNKPTIGTAIIQKSSQQQGKSYGTYTSQYSSQRYPIIIRATPEDFPITVRIAADKEEYFVATYKLDSFGVHNVKSHKVTIANGLTGAFNTTSRYATILVQPQLEDEPTK